MKCDIVPCWILKGLIWLRLVSERTMLHPFGHGRQSESLVTDVVYGIASSSCT